MKVLHASGPVLVLEETDATFMLRCVDAYCREAERVAPAQLRRATLLRADLGRFLAHVHIERERAATVDGVLAAGRPMMGSEGVAPGALLDLLTTPQAAALLGVSDSFVRRYAAERWGGTKVGGQWGIPRSAVLAHLRKQSQHGNES